MPLLKCDHLCWCWYLSLHFWPWPLTVPNGQCWQWLLIMHIFSFDPHHLPQMMLMVFPDFDSHTHPNIWVSYMLWPWKLTLPNGCWSPIPMPFDWCPYSSSPFWPWPPTVDRAKWRGKLSLATRLVPAMPNPFFGAREIWCFVSNPLDVWC